MMITECTGCLALELYSDNEFSRNLKRRKNRRTHRQRNEAVILERYYILYTFNCYIFVLLFDVIIDDSKNGFY